MSDHTSLTCHNYIFVRILCVVCCSVPTISSLCASCQKSQCRLKGLVSCHKTVWKQRNWCWRACWSCMWTQFHAKAYRNGFCRSIILQQRIQNHVEPLGEAIALWVIRACHHILDVHLKSHNILNMFLTFVPLFIKISVGHKCCISTQSKKNCAVHL